MNLLSRFAMHTVPFTREISIEQRFALPLFDHALDALRNTVEQRFCAALIAPAGTGKTTLLRALVDALPEARYQVHYVKVADLSKRDMCREIATAIGTTPAGSYPVLVRRVQERFRAVTDIDALRPVVLIDESHELRPDVLAMLRILTNFSMDSRLVVSIILAGQPPLAAMLRRDQLDDIARRLAHYATLRPLSREETQRYLSHRCNIAGANQLPFDESACQAIYEIGRGNLRATDHLALKALECADRDDHDLVSVNHVVDARKLLWP